MYNIGDLVVYSAHGVCKIYNIKEKSFLGEKKDYYEIHPVKDEKLFLSVPVERGSQLLFAMASKDEGENILNSFKEGCNEWIENNNERARMYSDILKSGEREDIADVLNTLISESSKLSKIEKKMNEKDKKILVSIEEILFSELSYALGITAEEVKSKAYKIIKSRLK